CLGLERPSRMRLLRHSRSPILLLPIPIANLERPQINPLVWIQSYGIDAEILDLLPIPDITAVRKRVNAALVAEMVVLTLAAELVFGHRGEGRGGRQEAELGGWVGDVEGETVGFEADGAVAVQRSGMLKINGMMEKRI